MSSHSALASIHHHGVCLQPFCALLCEFATERSLSHRDLFVLPIYEGFDLNGNIVISHIERQIIATLWYSQGLRQNYLAALRDILTLFSCHYLAFLRTLHAISIGFLAAPQEHGVTMYHPPLALVCLFRLYGPRVEH